MTTVMASIVLRQQQRMLARKSSCLLPNPPLQLLKRASCSSSAAAVVYDEHKEEEQPPALVELQAARLGYASPDNTVALTPPLDLHIHHPQKGGHVLLSRNGRGKTLVSNALVNENYVLEGSHMSDPKKRIAHVSFESHQELLDQGGSVYQYLANGNLNKAAQFLVVRFGLFPLLHRDVSTLSTGEIRKVMIVKALTSRPSLLILDNVFDGLDVASREALKDLISKTLKGFRPDILVQGVSSKATAHTQVILLTHRAEEMVPEMTTVSYFCDQDRLVTESREGRSGEELLLTALGMKDKLDKHNGLTSEPWKDDSMLPSLKSISEWWHRDRTEGDVNAESSASTPLVQAQALYVRRGEATLLDNINWTVEKGQRWLVAGHNGSGKSTLSRLLAREGETGLSEGVLNILGQPEHVNTTDTHTEGPKRRKNVGWVSTELHMALSRSEMSTSEILAGNKNYIPSSEVVNTVLKWLDLDVNLLSRLFSKLSQGEQKLILMASAIASRAPILVLDEPLHGLDIVNRGRILGLVERLCRATDMSLVYITHHYEEVIPNVTHVLHLEGGREVYNGSRQDYNPDAVNARVDR